MGGARKKGPSGVPKKESKFKIPTAFDCPLCDAKSTVQIKMKKALNIAEVRCQACGYPSPPYVYTLSRLSRPSDAFFAFYEDLRKKDVQATANAEIQLHATDAMKIPEGKGGDASEEEEGEDQYVATTKSKRGREQSDDDGIDITAQ